MIWLFPLTAIALVAVALPVLVHLLAQRRAPRVLFPTLRFVQPYRLAAVRKRALDDAALLAVRAAIVVAAVAAMAGPLLVTAERRRAWDARVVRAEVIDRAAASRAAAGRGAASTGDASRADAATAPSKADAASTSATAAPSSGGGAVSGAATAPSSTDPASPRTGGASTSGGAVSGADPVAGVFAVDRLGEGVARALTWLDAQPPGRREIVVRSPFPLGALTAADLSIVPAEVGLTFERTGALPATSTLPASPVIAVRDPRALSLVTVEREIELAGPRTSVRDLERDGAAARSPIEIIAPPAEQAMADTVLASALADRVPVPGGNRTARLVLTDPARVSTAAGLPRASGRGTNAVAAPRDPSAAVTAPASRQIASADKANEISVLSPRSDASAALPAGPGADARASPATPADAAPLSASDAAAPVTAAWMADAAARIARDLAARGWRATPLQFAAAGDRLVVIAGARAADPVTAVLARSIAAHIGAPAEQPASEVLAISDDQLRAWSRAPGPAAPPRPDTIDRDDRRWLWGAVLLLLALEAWMRRPRAVPVPATIETTNDETARVA